MLVMSVFLCFFGIASARLDMAQIGAMSVTIAISIAAFCTLQSSGLYDTLLSVLFALAAYQATYLLALIFSSYRSASGDTGAKTSV